MCVYIQTNQLKPWELWLTMTSNALALNDSQQGELPPAAVKWFKQHLSKRKKKNTPHRYVMYRFVPYNIFWIHTTVFKINDNPKNNKAKA